MTKKTKTYYVEERFLKEFEAQSVQSMVQKINDWVQKENVKILNYDRDFPSKMVHFVGKNGVKETSDLLVWVVFCSKTKKITEEIDDDSEEE